MLNSNIDVEANGIILSDPTILHKALQWVPQLGEQRDLLTELFSSELGQRVIDSGAIAPLLSIDDGGYEIICRYTDEPSLVENLIITRNGEFPLMIEDSAYFYDLESLIYWPPEEQGIDCKLPPGTYAISINGFRKIENNRIIRAGYEFVARPTSELIIATGQIDAYMRVFM
ncbi:hypothetical protein ACUXVY_22205 [Chromobacterium haemolyticum]|uniref:hypothetical protein n=1 Tax=Chromobacterium haemolyticum TaxID=394935 RepID=UPI0040579E0F